MSISLFGRYGFGLRGPFPVRQCRLHSLFWESGERIAGAGTAFASFGKTIPGTDTRAQAVSEHLQINSLKCGVPPPEVGKPKTQEFDSRVRHHLGYQRFNDHATGERTSGTAFRHLLVLRELPPFSRWRRSVLLRKESYSSISSFIRLYHGSWQSSQGIFFSSRNPSFVLSHTLDRLSVFSAFPEKTENCAMQLCIISISTSCMGCGPTRSRHA